MLQLGIFVLECWLVPPGNSYWILCLYRDASLGSICEYYIAGSGAWAHITQIFCSSKGVVATQSQFHVAGVGQGGRGRYPRKCALETIICGACWPLSRIVLSKPVGIIYPRSRAEVENCVRCFEACPHNDLLKSAYIFQSQKYIPEAVGKHDVEARL